MGTSTIHGLAGAQFARMPSSSSANGGRRSSLAEETTGTTMLELLNPKEAAYRITSEPRSRCQLKLS